MDDTTIVVETPGAQGAAGWTGAWNGISWSSVIAGAFTAVAVSFIIISLGTGIGMAVASPYASSPSVETMTVIGALWLVFAQAVGFAVGGYVAGRARRVPAGLHANEVKFRDGANGLVVWAVGVVVTALVLAVGVNKIGSATGQAAGVAALSASSAGTQAPTVGYYSDMLLRPTAQGNANAGGAAGASPAPASAATPNGAATGDNNAAAGTNTAGNANNGMNDNRQRMQVSRILVLSLGPNGLSNDDRAYLAQIVAAQTGMSQADAQKRVDDTINRMKDETTKAADAARKAAAFLSFWTFMSLLFGAACATLGGVLGGDLRDDFAGRVVAAR